MRLSCNGCRVLRKGCSDTCSIRPCLEWIKAPQAQANATLFLAKFYGRAGLVNLINAGPHHLRPAIFKSLLYEACGRIVNPIYGSAGLLWTGSWELCQEAVEAVLKGSPIKPISAEDSAANNAGLLPFRACDIRHITKHDKPLDLQKALMPVRQTRFKRSGSKSKGKSNPSEPLETKSGSSQNGSGLSRHAPCRSGGKDSDVVSAETAVAELQGGAEVLLELTLGFGSGSGPAQKERVDSEERNGKADFALGLAPA